MASSRLAYTLLPDATPESELDAPAAIYEFVPECHDGRKAADATGDRFEAMEVKNAGPKQSLP